MSDDFVKKEFSQEEITWHNKEEALLDEMGITRADADYLRRQSLSAEEAVAAKHEEQITIRQNKNRKDNWLEFLDIKARMGYVMDGSLLLRKIRKLLPQVFAYDGRVRGTIALVSPIVKSFDDGYHAGWEYVGWIYRDWNPEYTIDYLDEADTPVGNRQGWRTLLLRNQIKRDGTGKWTLKGSRVVQDGTGNPLFVMREPDVLKVFGDPSNGETASGYRRQLWRFRHGMPGDFDLSKWF